MLFNSLSYLLFFPVVMAAYWLSPKRWRRALLLAASYFFYMSWLKAYGLLLLALTATNYLLGLLLDRFRDRRKAILLAGLAVNLGALCFYKYTNFLLAALSDGMKSLGPWLSIQPDLPTANIILPLGISFFAFEFIHYLMDIYRGHKPIRSLVDFGLFAAFFPSQIAGPIKRYQDFMHQLGDLRTLSRESLHTGLTLILQGLFKKVALSDNLAPLVSTGFQHTASIGTLDAWIATVAFAFQIYFDFSGYTDIGRGSALLLGFSLPDNFNLPYIASNLSDFWKRWHISLSSWLRDYLYIPLGGGRQGRWRKHANLLITMLLGGLWHGAAWHYVAWGGFHGLGLVVSHEYESLAGRSKTLTAFHKTAVGKASSLAVTFTVVLVGWVLFRAESVGSAFEIITRHFILSPSDAVVGLLLESPVIVALPLYSIYALLVNESFKQKLPALHAFYGWLFEQTSLRWPIYAGAFLAAIGFCPTKAEPFIYFQF
jgi:D-alanyl-lipoteichoic acid acyltransferase DltB (MBOAT superfamily)